MTSCGELAIQLLEAYGVRTAFGIPGVHNIELYRGLASSSIRHVTARHEQGAGFMADGYARSTGEPGVAFIVTGPGVTNVSTAMAQAYADSVPLLVLAGVNRRGQLGLGTGRLHEMVSQVGLARNVSAWAHTLLRPDELPDVMRQAFGLLRSARPRPVFIEIPQDVFTTEAGSVSWSLPGQVTRPAPAASAVAAAADLLSRASRPVLLFGGGCVEAPEEATALAEALDAPVVLTVNGRGILPVGHPLTTLHPSLEPVRELIREADVVLAAGTELGETDYDIFFRGDFQIPGRLIRVDIDPSQVFRNATPGIGIVGDAKLTLRALLEAAPDRGTTMRSGAARAEEVREAVWTGASEGLKIFASPLEVAQEVLPDLIAVGDSTQPVYASNLLHCANRPRSWFNSCTGFGALGYGLPAAIGAKVACPDRPVVCLVGDGGLQFSLPELSSAVEAKAPVIVLLWNNDAYQEIKWHMEDNGIEAVGVRLSTPNFVAVAEAYGCAAERATSLEELRQSVGRAAARHVPTVIQLDQEDFLPGIG